jgi:hypothetical protein
MPWCSSTRANPSWTSCSPWGASCARPIPPEDLECVVNGKPAIEWAMERYQVTTDEDSGIRNDPNDWCAEHGDPRYIVDLVKHVVRVSVKTARIVNVLPSLVLPDYAGFSFIFQCIVFKRQNNSFLFEGHARSLFLDSTLYSTTPP